MGWLQAGYGEEMVSSFPKIQPQQYWVGSITKKEQ